MAIISREYKYIFICVPGTGSTATADYLIKEAKGQWSGEMNIVKHYNLSQLSKHELIKENDIDTFFKFATVRNPFDFYVSDWIRHRQWKHFLEDENSWLHTNELAKRRVQLALDNDFDQYLEQLLSHIKKPMHKDQWYWEGVDHLIKKETLNNDLQVVFDKIRIKKKVKVPQLNVTQGKKDYKKYYSDFSRQLIEKKFLPDLEKFSYLF